MLVREVEHRFKELVAQICLEQEWEILAIEVIPDHVHLFLNVLPSDSPSDIMVKLKGVTSHILRQEFDHYSLLSPLYDLKHIYNKVFISLHI